MSENPVSLRHWIVAGPEQARLLKKFEINSVPIVKTHTSYIMNSAPFSTRTLQDECKRFIWHYIQ